VTIATETYSGTALDSFSLTDSGTETLELDESDGSWTLAGETDQFRIWDSISNVADLWGSWSEDTVSVDSVSGTSSDVFANDYSTDVLGADSLSGTASDSSDSYTLTVWQYSNSEESAAGSQGSGWLIADSNVLSTYSLEAHGTDSFNWENSDQSTMSYYLDGLSTASYGGSCSLSAGLDVAPFQEKYSESESETSDVSGWTTQSAGLDTYSNEGVTSSLTDDVDSQLYGNESYFGYTDDVTETVTNSSWLNGTDGSHTSWVTESSLSTESGSEAGGGFGLGGVTGLPETSTDGSLLAWITREQGEAYPTNEFVLYDSPRTVAAYLSSPTGQLVVAGLGEVMFDDPFDLAVGFVPSTNAMTAHGLPAEKVNTFNLAENNGPTDGVSQTATSPPTSVLVTLAAAGRNPTDILIPTQAGTDGSGGDDDEDQASAPAATGSASAAGEDEPTDDDEEGSHLTREQVTILLANGYAPANIMAADAALAEGASREQFEFILGARAQAERPVQQPATDPNAGIAQAAEVLEATAKVLVVAGKQMVLGELTDEQNALGTAGQVVLGFTALDTAADIRDIAALSAQVRANPNNAAARTKLKIYIAAAAIPFVTGAMLAKMLGKAAGEGAEELVEAAAKQGDEIAPGVAKNGDELLPGSGGLPGPSFAKAKVIDPADAVMGGPKDGKYIAYHGTTEAGAENIANKGIDSNLLGEAQEFQMAIDPTAAANFGAGAIEDAGGGVVNLVRFEIPEDLFIELVAARHIKNGATTGSLVFDQIAQAAINKAMGK
jgi:hypothetical protein